MPICSGKEKPENKEFYKKLLNDTYLSLATGSENYKFKVRNLNEEVIYKNEDDMFKLDFSIELFQRCLRIIDEELSNNEGRSGPNYSFPV